MKTKNIKNYKASPYGTKKNKKVDIQKKASSLDEVSNPLYELAREKAELQRRAIKRFVGRFVKQGHRQGIESVFRNVFSDLAKRFKKHPLNIFNRAIIRIKPSIEIITRKAGGTSYRIPTLLSEDKSYLTASHWMAENLIKRPERTLKDKIYKELSETYRGKNTSLRKKKHQLHKLGLANRAFLNR